MMRGFDAMPVLLKRPGLILIGSRLLDQVWRQLALVLVSVPPISRHLLLRLRSAPIPATPVLRHLLLRRLSTSASLRLQRLRLLLTRRLSTSASLQLRRLRLLLLQYHSSLSQRHRLRQIPRVLRKGVMEESCASHAMQVKTTLLG